MPGVLPGNDEGVNILVDYLFMMIITIIIFTAMFLLVNEVQSRSDRIVLSEEFDIISNDVANRLSTFSDEIYLNQHAGDNEKALVTNINGQPGEETYFDLPELVRGKQYAVKIGHVGGNTYTVTVSSTSNSAISSVTTFYNAAEGDGISINPNEFYSQPGRYMISFDKASNLITAGVSG